MFVEFLPARRDVTSDWRHNWRPISFTLVVDDFGVKYINKADVEHLMSVLKEDYEIDTDWEGTRYLGLTLDWDYQSRGASINAGLHRNCSHSFRP